MDVAPMKKQSKRFRLWFFSDDDRERPRQKFLGTFIREREGQRGRKRERGRDELCEVGNEERENPTATSGLRERDETENLVASRWERVSEKESERGRENVCMCVSA